MSDVALDVRPLQGGDGDRGVGSYVRTLSSLASIRRVVAWAGLELPLLGREVTVVRVPGRPRSGRLGWAQDAAVSSAALRSAAVHVPTLNVGFGANPRLLTVHDAIPWRFPLLYPSGRIGALRRKVEAGMARRAQRVVTDSHASADDLVTNLGVQSARIEVIPLAADPDWCESAPADVAAVRVRHQLPERYVVASGGFAHHDPRKRLEDAVDALALLPDDVALAITGKDGTFSGPLIERVRSLGLGQRVHLTGQLSGPDLSALFTGASVFVFPSLWEGFGLPLLHAFRCGVPAVVSDGGALPEVGGGAALVHPVGDVGELAAAVRAVLEDRVLAAELRARGVARAGDFCRAKALAAHEEIYASF